MICLVRTLVGACLRLAVLDSQQGGMTRVSKCSSFVAFKVKMKNGYNSKKINK